MKNYPNEVPMKPKDQWELFAMYLMFYLVFVAVSWLSLTSGVVVVPTLGFLVLGMWVMVFFFGWKLAKVNWRLSTEQYD